MKRLLFVLLAVFFLVSCGEKKPETSPGTSPTPSAGVSVAGSVRDYFPMKADTQYEFETITGRESKHTVYTTYLNDDTVQRRFVYGVYNPTELIQYKDGKIMLIFADPQFNYFEQIPKELYNRNDVLLAEPLEKGAKWFMNTDIQCEVTGINVPLEIPYGKVDALEVTATITDGSVKKFYYAKGLGLVKTLDQRANGQEDAYGLKAIKEGTSLAVNLEFFWHDPVADEIKSETRELSINTNTDIVKLLESELKKGDKSLFTPNTKINSLEISRKESLLLLDLSSEFLSEMVAGSGIEQNLLQCITDTLGKFYETDKVQITVDGKRYESGHIVMEIGEYLNVTK